MTNNDKFNRIDQILKDLYASVKYDGVILNGNAVYNYLVQMDVPSKQRDKELDGSNFRSFGKDNLFIKWIDRFIEKKNIKVFCDLYWRYFCQFTNGKVSHDCIKIYIPLDYNHIYEGANKIFDFLEKNNISHLSKIGKHIRFDDIVIRVNNKEDADKIQKFVNNDPYFKEGFIKNNPFAFNNNGCSYAYDGSISYNSCLSKMIKSYIDVMVKNPKFNINDVSANNFYYWINSISNNLDVISNFTHNDSSNKLCVDAYFVVNLIKLAMTSNDMKDYYNYIEICKNHKIRNKVTNAVYNGDGYLDFDSLVDVNDNDKDKVELFNELILTTMKKYPMGYDEEHPNYSGFNYILAFLKGDTRGVTRDNGLRNRVKESLKSEDVYDIVKNSGVIGEDDAQQLYNYIKVVMLNDVISMMKIRFPNNYINNINKFIETNNERYITDSIGNARQLVITMDSSVINKLFSDLYIKDIYEYMDRYYVDTNTSGRKLRG